MLFMNFEIYCDESRQDIPKELDKIRQEETQRIFDRYGIK